MATIRLTDLPRPKMRTRTLAAVYGGNGDFTGAASAPKTLKVVT